MSAEQNVVEAPVERRSSQGAGESGGAANGGFDMEDGSRSPAGMGQSKSSRRRRRKRKKGDGPDDGGFEAATSAPEFRDTPAPAAAPQAGSIPSVQASAGSAPAAQTRTFTQGDRPRSFQGQANGSGAAAQGTKKWKKKFRERDRDRRGGSDNFGNQAPSAGGFSGGNGGYSNQGGNGYSSGQAGGRESNGNGSGEGSRDFGRERDRDSFQPGNVGPGFKRKGSGFSSGARRSSSAPRGFVGPMDHSYRAINGTFTEAPPSTIDTSTGYGFSSGRRAYGESGPMDYSQGRPIVIAEDAPTHIYFFIEDLFFIAKISETAKKLGVKIAFIKNDKESIAALTGGEDDDQKPSLIVFDLNNASAKPMTLIPKLRSRLKKSVSIVGFLSHLQGDLKAKAVEAGCDTVMPRAAFSQNLPNLLRRYGIEDVEEANFNQ